MTRGFRSILGDLADLGMILIFVCAVAMAYIFAVVLHAKALGIV